MIFSLLIACHTNVPWHIFVYATFMYSKRVMGVIFGMVTGYYKLLNACCFSIIVIHNWIRDCCNVVYQRLPLCIEIRVHPTEDTTRNVHYTTRNFHYAQGPLTAIMQIISHHKEMQTLDRDWNKLLTACCPTDIL